MVKPRIERYNHNWKQVQEQEYPFHLIVKDDNFILILDPTG